MQMRERKAADGGGAAASDVPEGLGFDVLAAWMSASPDGVVVLDGDLRIVYLNPAYSALCGHEPGFFLLRWSHQ